MKFLFSQRLRYFFIACAACFFVGALSLVIIARELPSFEEITSARVTESTRIVDRAGNTTLYELYKDERRTYVTLDEIPRALQEATIAIEDKDFYSHEAFSIRGILRAALANMRNREVVEGGSTITQQLARSMFLNTERTIMRKVRELLLALRIEQQYDKRTILEMYLNQVPYGGQLYGVESASEAYFGKRAKDLTLAESALLASLPKGPSYYSPWGKQVDELLARKNLVLSRMQELGYITEQEAERAKKEPLKFLPQRTEIIAPHFVSLVTKYLVNRYGEDFVRTGGLTVITTLDLDLQRSAERAVIEGSKRNEELYNGKNAALVAVDPKTGQILAYVGSRNYFETENDGKFDIASLGLRQPGSTIKPFAYYTAFTKGYTPDTILFDVPTDFNTSANQFMRYAPENFDGIFRGPVTMRQALGQSLNVPSVKTLYLAGLADTIKTSLAFGLSTLTETWRYGLSLALGGGEVKLVDLVGAYAVFAADGHKHPQAIILEVRDKDNRVLEKFTPQPSRVGDVQSVRLINDILSDIEIRSGLLQSSLSLTMVPGYDIALKTGTTNDYRDAWAVGYTPSLVVGVWAGNNDNSPMQRHGSSLLAALPIWSQFIKEALPRFPQEAFVKPAPIAVDKPILNGVSTLVYEFNGQQYSQLHDTLYYVLKDNPRGPIPQNPNSDPQFKNWEEALFEWARINVDQFETYNQPIPRGATPTWSLSLSRGAPTIVLFYPRVGDFITRGDFFTIRGRVEAQSHIERVSISINETLIAEHIGPFPSPYPFQFFVRADNLAPQNIISATAQTVLGEKAETQVIFYGK